MNARPWIVMTVCLTTLHPVCGQSTDGSTGSKSVQARSVLQHLQEQAANAPLRLRFDGKTREDALRWQAAFAAKLKQLLGPHAPPATWQTMLRGAVDLNDHRREDLLLIADGVPPLPIYLLIPLPKSETRRPGIVALHGHGSHGHHPIAGRSDLPGVAKAIDSANYDYGLQLVRRGYVVACPCMTPFGERLGKREVFGKQDPCADTFLRMQLHGQVLMAENLRDVLWAVELLARHVKVDQERLGCVGLSYGGRMAMLAAALEPRLKVAIVSGALNLMQERASRPYSCGAQIIPGLLEYGDTPEIAGLIAPRASLWEAGLKDSLIVPRWADEAWERIHRVYRALDKENGVQLDRFAGGHVWHGARAYPLLESVLRPATAP